MSRSKKKVIGFVVPNLPSYSETFLISKIKGLLLEGFEIKLFVKQPFPSGYSTVKYYTYPNVPRKDVNRFFHSIFIFFELLFRSPLKLFRLIHLGRDERFSKKKHLRTIVANRFIILHNLDWVHFAFASAALDNELIGKVLGAKVSTSLRGYDIAVRPVKEPGCYNLLWKHIDKVHTISDDLLELAHLDGLSPQIPFQKITPAIDISQFNITKQFSDDEKEPIFTTVARLHWKKGLEYTLEALSVLKRRGYDFTYRIIGSGTEFEKLKFAAYQLGISENVEFIGKVPHEHIANEMIKSTIYLQYSVQEGFCNAVLEAQAMGLLCIVSDAEGLAENVLNQKTGWVVPKRNPEKLAAKIIEVLRLPKEKKVCISIEARKRIAESFNLAKQQKEFKTFFT